MIEMKKFSEKICAVNKGFCVVVPSMNLVQQFVDDMVLSLFPLKIDCQIHVDETLEHLENCGISLERILTLIENGKNPEEIRNAFFEKLPDVYDEMIMDANAISKFDPASSSVEEVILCYPGFYCIAVYRIAHILHNLNVPLIPRMMMEYVHGKTGIDIHPGARIGSPFFIDHGTGIVIGETSEIGKNVKLYQGVTLGAISVEKKLANTKRHPTIEDNVVIYAGSTILGGKTVIGHDTVIGGNTWITESILPHSIVFRQHRVLVKDKKGIETPPEYFI